MKAITKQLNDLAFLETYLAGCPKNCLSRVIDAELHRISSTQTINDNPIIKIRWINLKNLLNDPSSINSDAMPIYATMTEHCRQVIKTFADQHEEMNQKLSTELLKKQQLLFFGDCLKTATETALQHYQSNVQKKPDQSPLKAPDILELALSMYKNALYREALHEYEISVLVGRYTSLLSSKQALLKQHVTQDTLETIENELGFINIKLGIQESSHRDLISFKLTGTELIYDELAEFHDLTSDNLSSQISTLLSEFGEKPIDEEFSLASNLRGLKINDYLCVNSFSEHFKKIMANVETTIKNFQLPQGNNPSEVNTEDMQLKNLREITNEYTSHLTSIENNENKSYENRDPRALHDRKQAVATLKSCLDQASTLTPNVHEVAKILIAEIKLNQPHWSELSFINKILDVLTLGLRALIRYTTFQPAAPLKSLEKSIAEFNPSATWTTSESNCS